MRGSLPICMQECHVFFIFNLYLSIYIYIYNMFQSFITPCHLKVNKQLRAPNGASLNDLPFKDTLINEIDIVYNRLSWEVSQSVLVRDDLSKVCGYAVCSLEYIIHNEEKGFCVAVLVSKNRKSIQSIYIFPLAAQ